MLPSNLLVATVRRGRIEPLLLKPEGIPLAIAGELLDRLRKGAGKKQAELLAELADLEELALESGMDLRIVRAMATLALRASKFERVKYSVDPLRARLVVFETAGERFGIPVTGEERMSALAEAASKLGCSVAEVEKVLSAYGEEVLVEPPSLSEEELVKRLNLSMVQTLLFRALRLEVEVAASGAVVKKLLRAVKKLGLLYMAEQAGKAVRLTIDGPASLLRQTRRYGTRLAKLVPYVMLADKWAMRAEVEGSRGTLKFELNSSSSRLFPLEEVEREFFKSLSTLAPNWIVKREPEPLVAGGRILIPDFSVSCGDRIVYIEIVGFWTKEYLERKLQKLRELSGVKMLVAVDEELACSSISELPHEVILFRKKLRGSDVYPALRRLLGPPSAPSGGSASPVKVPEGLPDLAGKTLREAAGILEGMGIEAARIVEVLEQLGYTIEWRSLDPSQAVLRRRS